MLHKSATPPSLSEKIDSSFPAEVEKVIAKCLRKNPEDRYKSFSELQGQLVDLQSTLRTANSEEANEQAREVIAPAFIQKLVSSKFLSNKINISILIFVLSIATVAVVVFAMQQKASNARIVSTKKASPLINTKADMDSFEPLLNPNTKQGFDESSANPFKVTIKNGLAEVQTNYQGISDRDLSRLRTLPTIRHLQLARTKVTGVGFKNWTSPQINSMFLDSCPISYDGFKAIGELPGLESLTLREVELKRPFLRLIVTNSNLSLVSLSCKGLPEEALKELSDSKTISNLEVSDLTLTDTGIKHLLAIKTLTDLKFRGCTLTESAYAWLAKPTHLNTLSLAEVKVDQASLNNFFRASTPALGFHQVIMEPSVLNSLKGRPRIYCLQVTSPGITQKDLADIRNSFPRNGNFGFGNEALDKILDGMGAFRETRL
ncbi:MAG: hypothetical protein SGJ27_03085 [Candidatus Melainabacteria bacterium]|nr:hypothetical protein [Candidatus Melainabacteria bacterium]